MAFWNGFTSKSECHKAIYSTSFALLYIVLFVDATSLFLIVDNPMCAALCLSSYLKPLSQGAAIWLVTLNPSKI